LILATAITSIADACRFACIPATVNESACMPRRRQVMPPPRAYSADGDWPHGPLLPDSPVAARYAREIARRLLAAVGERSRTEVADRADLSRSALHDLTTGRTWPDVVSLAKLESSLTVRLWPDEFP
jgi:hypothetical protein